MFYDKKTILYQIKVSLYKTCAIVTINIYTNTNKGIPHQLAGQSVASVRFKIIRTKYSRTSVKVKTV